MAVRRRWRFRPPSRASAAALLAAVPPVPGARIRETRRLRVPYDDVGVKVFHHEGASAGRRARREWRVANALADLGVPAAEPVALCESAAADYYFFRWKAERVDLQAAILEARLAPDQRRRLSSELGALLRRLHDAGFVHRDFHAANVLVDPGGSQAPELLDFHRCRRRRWRAATSRRDDVLAFSHFFFRRARPSERLRFLRGYGGDLWPAERGGRHRFLQELGLAAALSFHRFLCRYERRCLGAGRKFHCIEGGVLRGVVDRGAAEPQALRILEELVLHGGAGPSPGRVTVPGLGTVRTQVFPAAAAGSPASSARQVWMSRYRLRMAEIDTPRAVLFLEGRRPRRTHSLLFLLEEDASPAPVTLAEVLGDPARAPQVLDLLAEQLARVHDEFLSVPELTVEKFLVDPASGALTWLATEAHRVHPFAGNETPGDVHALLESLPEAAVAGDARARFLRRYLRCRRACTAAPGGLARPAAAS